MRFLYRLRWDCLYTPWQPVHGDMLRSLVDSGAGLLLRVESPLDWRFNSDIMDTLRDAEGYQIAVESTLIHIELKGVK